MHISLHGRSAVITGAGTGIGRATAVMMAESGAAVTLVGRREAPLRETAEQVGRCGGASLVVRADVGDAEGVDGVFAAHSEQFGGLDILVNNAGVTGPTARVADMDIADWEDTIRVNLTGPFLCARRALPLLRASGRGRVITIGSLSAHYPRLARSPYCASKAGLLGLNRTLALEEGPNGVLVNYVCPGTVDGERVERVFAKRAEAKGTTPEAERALRGAQSAIQRLLQPEEIAGMCVFLASDLASGITGEVINISGGRHA